MDPILLRKHLQENASDLQDFCKDLSNWGEEMKRKEAALKNGDSEKVSSSPSIDLKKLKTKDKTFKKSKPKTATSKKPASKIGTTDYAAWDKFDADAECEKLEDDINDDSELTDECNDNMQDLALIEKEKGNKFVKSQKWDEAIKCYNKAIEYYSYDPIFYANRALCYLKKNNYEQAEKDCDLSLKLDKTYVKAYQRRAVAREGLNKLSHAEYDLMQVLQLEPKNKESGEHLERLRKTFGKIGKEPDQRPVSKFTASRSKSNINKIQTDLQAIETKKIFDTSKPVSPWPEEDDIILVKPINKPPHLRSKKPLKRIKIKEKGDTAMEEIKISEPEAIKQHVLEKRERIEPANDVSHRSEDNNAWPRSDQPSLSLKSDDFKVIEKKPPDVIGWTTTKDKDRSNITTTPDVPNRSLQKEEKNTSNINISNENKKTESDKANPEFVKPKTSVQFNLTWKNLKKSEEKYTFLKQVDPEDLPRIFLNSLESNVFSGILEVMVDHFIGNGDPVFRILDYFTQVKRFETFTMFMSSPDKKNLWKLLDYAKEVEGKTKEDVDRLIAKYEL